MTLKQSLLRRLQLESFVNDARSHSHLERNCTICTISTPATPAVSFAMAATSTTPRKVQLGGETVWPLLFFSFTWFWWNNLYNLSSSVRCINFWCVWTSFWVAQCHSTPNCGSSAGWWVFHACGWASDSVFIESTQPVVPIGYVAHAMPVTAASMKPTSASTPWPSVIPGRQYKFNAINVVAPLNPYSMLPFPNTKNTPLIKPGYQEVHHLYDDMRKHFANKAYSTAANAEVVVVKIWMKTRVPSKKNPLDISVSRSW